MDFEGENECWTNFDLLDAVKRISAQNALPYYKGHKIVAEELLYELGELSIDCSQSDEDRLLVSNFRKTYIYVIQKFKSYHNNFESPAVQDFGKQIFWEVKKRRSIDNSEVIMSSQDSNTSKIDGNEKMKVNRSMKSLQELKLGSTQMRKRLKPIIEDVKQHASVNDIEVTRLLGLLIHTINYSATGEGCKAKAAIGLSLFEDNIPESEITTVEALSLMTNYKFGKRQYINLRLDLKPYLLLPTYKNVKLCKDMLIPKLDILPESLVGVKYLYKKALLNNFSQFFQIHPELNSTHYKVVIKDGCDSSGRHPVYN